MADPSSSGVGVLVIDDEVDNAELMAEVLTLHGYRAEYATSAADGLAAFHDRGHRVVISDLNLPDRSGYELAQELAVANDPPLLIALTGMVGDDVAERCRKAGFAHHVTKPVSWDSFFSLLKTR